MLSLRAAARGGSSEKPAHAEWLEAAGDSKRGFTSLSIDSVSLHQRDPSRRCPLSGIPVTERSGRFSALRPNPRTMGGRHVAGTDLAFEIPADEMEAIGSARGLGCRAWERC